MRKYLAVFDWNGTLFDDFSANYAGGNAALALFNAGPLSREHYLETFTFPILHFYTANGISADDYLSRHTEASQTFLEIYEREALTCGLRPGTKELLLWLNDMNVTCIVLSNHLHDNLERQIERLGIRPLLHSVSGNTQSDAAMMTKLNKSERLATFMQEHGFTPERSFIVGDSHEEQDIGHHMGVTCFSIDGGCLSRARLAKGPHEALISSLSEIRPFLEANWFRAPPAAQIS